MLVAPGPGQDRQAHRRDRDPGPGLRRSARSPSASQPNSAESGRDDCCITVATAKPGAAHGHQQGRRRADLGERPDQHRRAVGRRKVRRRARRQHRHRRRRSPARTAGRTGSAPASRPRARRRPPARAAAHCAPPAAARPRRSAESTACQSSPSRLRGFAIRTRSRSRRGRSFPCAR